MALRPLLRQRLPPSEVSNGGPYGEGEQVRASQRVVFYGMLHRRPLDMPHSCV